MLFGCRTIVGLLNLEYQHPSETTHLPWNLVVGARHGRSRTFWNSLSLCRWSGAGVGREATHQPLWICAQMLHRTWCGQFWIGKPSIGSEDVPSALSLPSKIFLLHIIFGWCCNQVCPALRSAFMIVAHCVMIAPLRPMMGQSLFQSRTGSIWAQLAMASAMCSSPMLWQPVRVLPGVWFCELGLFFWSGSRIWVLFTVGFSYPPYWQMFDLVPGGMAQLVRHMLATWTSCQRLLIAVWYGRLGISFQHCLRVGAFEISFG